MEKADEENGHFMRAYISFLERHGAIKKNTRHAARQRTYDLASEEKRSEDDAKIKHFVAGRFSDVNGDDTGTPQRYS